MVKRQTHSKSDNINVFCEVHCSDAQQMTLMSQKLSLQLGPCISKTIFFFRIENLELLSQYGGAAWKIHNETLTRILAQQQKKLVDIK